VEIKGKCVVPGSIKGETLVSREPISFLGDVDPETGIIIAENHPLKNISIANKIFVFPYGKGSTVGSYIIYQLFKNGKAPAAIINQEAETIIAVGAIISGIPMVHKIDISKIPNGIKLELDAHNGTIRF